jgi:hypothetical protein
MEQFAASVLPLRIASAVTPLGSASPGWTLLDPGVDRDRVFSAYIGFEKAFSQTPVLQVGIAGFDIENGDASRLRVRVRRISAEGFTVELQTWFNTRIWSVDLSWFAIGH